MTTAGANPARLEAFVADRVAASAAMPSAAASAFLDRNADHVEGQLQALSSWAADPAGRRLSPHLDGLGAFALSDAADALRAEAVRRARGGIAG